MTYSREQRDGDDRMLAALKTERSPHEIVWKEIRDFFNPRGGAFPDETKDGSRTDQEIINETAVWARRTAAQGMWDGITPRSRPWVNYLPPDPELAEYGPVKEWLNILQQRTHAILLKSNIYGSFHHMFDRMVTYGPGCFGLYDSYDAVIRSVRYDIGSYFWTSDSSGKVNGFWREYKLSVEQMVAEFGLKNCSSSVRSAYDTGNYTGMYPVVHLIELNANRDITKIDNQNLPFRSCYYQPDNKENNLRDSGFDRFPIIAGRWEVFQMGPWASSPGMDCIGSVKQLQVQELIMGEGIEKQVNPPMQIPASVQDQIISTLPGGKTYINETQGSQGVRELYQVQLDTNSLSADISRVEERIKSLMYAKQFLAISNDEGAQRRTAAEIYAIKDEQLSTLGRVLEGTDIDVLNPVIDIVFDKIMRHQLVPPPPQELQGQALKIEYISRLHQVQKAAAIEPIQRTASFAGEIANINLPIKVDMDQAIDDFALAVGAPPKMVRTDEQVAEINAQNAQAEQNMQRMAMAQQAADIGKTMSETPAGEGTALDMLLGQS